MVHYFLNEYFCAIHFLKKILKLIKFHACWLIMYVSKQEMIKCSRKVITKMILLSWTRLSDIGSMAMEQLDAFAAQAAIVCTRLAVPTIIDQSCRNVNKNVVPNKIGLVLYCI